MYTDNNDNNFNNDNSFDNDNNINNNENLQNDLNVDNDFYKYENQQYEMNNKPKKSKKIILWIVIILIILIALFGSLAFFYFRSRENNNTGNGGNGTEQPVLTPNVVLNITEFSLKVGNTKKIEYTIENDNGNVVINWSSSDTKIATVDNTGTVKGVKAGTATITASYTIDDQTYEKTCTVTVVKDSSSGTGGSSSGGSSSGGSSSGGSSSTGTTTDKTAPKLSHTITKGKENTWVNTDVVISVTASDNSGSVTVEYDLNCTIKTCDYKKVTNNTITISSEGPTEVMIRATDKAGNETEDKVTVKIDKTKPSCSLDVNETGTLTGTPKDTGGSNLVYNGFSSTYSGTSTTSQTLSKAGTYTYYVKDNAGNTNTCSLEVKAKTQYRYQDCTSCKSCIAAGCNEFTDWTDTGTKETVGESYKNYSTDYRRFNGCTLQESGKYECSVQTRKCKSPKTSCSSCGCSAYGSWSSWSDTAVTKTSTRNVETKTIYSK